MGRIGLNGPHPGGLLRDRCTLLQAQRTRDGAGGFTTEYNALPYKTPCEKVGFRAPAEVVILGQLRRYIYERFILDARRSVGFTTEWRILDCDNVEWEPLSMSRQNNVIIVECRNVPETSGDCGV